MIALIGPAEGAVAAASRRLAGQWEADGIAVQALSVDAAGRVFTADCRCAVGPVDGKSARRLPVALTAIRAAWSHRRCLWAADGLHLELGRGSVGAFWFGLTATALTGRRLVTVIYDWPITVRRPTPARAHPVPRGGQGRRRIRLARQAFWSLVERRLVALLRSRSKATAALSEPVAREARRQGWQQVQLISHGAEPRSSEVVAPSGGGYVLWAGSIRPGKGLDVLARAWCELERTEPSPLPLIIAGGWDAADADWVAGARAAFRPARTEPRRLGPVSDAEFTRLIRGAAIVVLPGERSNPVSGVLIRALSQGRAVVASRVPAATAEIANGLDGLLVTPSDYEELALAIGLLTVSPWLRDQLGEHAAARAAARHTWPGHAAALAELHSVAPARPAAADTPSESSWAGAA